MSWIEYLYGEERNYRWFEIMKKKLLYLYEFKLKKDNNVLLVNYKKICKY